MHLLVARTTSIEENEAAVDLEQSPAESVALSFADSDLSGLAGAWEANRHALPGLRLASLQKLRHPLSVDLYIERVISHARFVLIRLLGGQDYWRYGLERIAAECRRTGAALAVVPGCKPDPRLVEASTISPLMLSRFERWMTEGGPDNLGQALCAIGSMLGRQTAWKEPKPVPPAGLYKEPIEKRGLPALIVFYRSAYLAVDTAPIDCLIEALRTRGLDATAVYVTSLKDVAAAETVEKVIQTTKPRIILNLTAFSAMRADETTILDTADCPVLQVVMSGSTRDAWEASPRGLKPSDLAMHVVLPELDGRIMTRAIAFKAESVLSPELESTRLVYASDAGRVAFTADLAAAWAQLSAIPLKEKRIALVLPDYPGRGGRAGYAVGLDTPASTLLIIDALQKAGYHTGTLPEDKTELMTRLVSGADTADVPLATYESELAQWPATERTRLIEAWGEPEDDPQISEGAFRFRILQAGNVAVALQPDRGDSHNRKTSYHDPALPPRHAYVAFHLWLRATFQAHALVQLGTHGTLEWLPGKATALSAHCYPERVLGALPVIYPFIINDPGEAAQAKRRIAAVTIGHLTPPLVQAGLHGAAAEMEALIDEYGAADGLDRRRAGLLRAEILERARITGLADVCDIAENTDPDDALARLDAWLCDVKEMSIRDGLHIFGGTLDPTAKAHHLEAMHHSEGASQEATSAALDACGGAEISSLLAALGGRRVAPGPSGTPTRGRTNVLPTGRNLTTVDPRAVPSRTATVTGSRAADAFIARYVQDEGDWPRRVVLDLWASAAMRTGGDDLGHAFALLGVMPLWDTGSARVSGFEIRPLAVLERPRVDVTVRLSGLFRDIFPAQIALFDQAVRAVAALDESEADNPLAEARRRGEPLARVFGGAPGTYGAGAASLALDGDWNNRDALGEAYLAAGAWSYGEQSSEGIAAQYPFRARVATADALVHTQDDPGLDPLNGDGVADFMGGFAAAAELLEGSPRLYHLDTSQYQDPKIRSLTQAIDRTVQGRLTNPRWIEGQMRHGWRGAAELAQGVDALFAFAATTNAVRPAGFEALFNAYLDDDRVRTSLAQSNPDALKALSHRLMEAVRRGFWQPRRNSTGFRLGEWAGLA